MSTRSAVAVVVGDSWRGRYVHSDGYPSHLLPTLLALIERDGKEAVLKKITEDRYGWSSLNPAQPSIEGVEVAADASYSTYAYGTPEYTAWNLGPGGGYGDGRFANEPGYGIAYTEVNGQSSPDQWVTPDENWGTEWVYVVGPMSIQVLEQVADGTVLRGSVPFGTVVDQSLLDSLDPSHAPDEAEV